MNHPDLPLDLPRTAGVRLIGMPSPFRDDMIERVGEAGRTVAELVETALEMKLDPFMANGVRVSIGDTIVLREHWHRVRPKPGTVVMVRVVPQNGGFLRIALTLAVIVAAAYLGPLAAGYALGTTAGAVAAGTSAVSAATFGAVSAAATGIIGIGANLLLNALIPPAAPNLGGSAPSPTYSIGGTRNTGAAWGYIPSVLGRHRMAPVYLARPYTEVRGSDQYLRVMFLWGYGPLRIEDMRIGETLVTDFDDIEIETREGLPDDPPTTLYPGQVFEEALSIYLASDADPSIRRTEEDTDEISVDLSFPRGLIDYSKSGKKKAITSTVTVEMRKVGDAAWTLVTTLSTTEKRQEPFRRGYRWVVPKGQYDVRLQRTDEEADSGTDRTEWTTLRSMRIGSPYTFRKPLATTTILIKAQDQLQGVIDTLTGIANSRCPDWDQATSTWITRETSSPASLYRYALQGPACSQPRSDAQINLPVIQDWHEHCVALGLEFNMVRDFEATLPSTLADIAAAGHAAWAMPDGRWTVVIDRPQTEIRQHFTGRNSYGFTTEPIFGEIPHCYRARFVDRDADWDVNAERLVFDEGYNADNATLYQEIQFPGVTEAGRVWKDCKRAFASLRGRFLAHSTNVDWEYLVARRGQLAVAAHPVVGAGLVSGRVKRVTVAGTVATVLLDDEVTMMPGRSYVLRCRNSQTGATLLRPVVNPFNAETTTTAVRIGGVGGLPSPDDLFLFGEEGTEVRRLIIKGIEPSSKMTARLTFVDEAPEIHAVENLTPPAWVPRQPQRDQDIPAVPQIISVSSGDAAQTVGEDGSILAPVTVGIAPGGGGRVAASLFVVRHRPFGSTAPWLTASVAAAQGVVRILGYEPGEIIELQAQAVSEVGKASRWTTPPLSHTVAARTLTPPDVATLTITNLSNGLRRYEWTLSDPDGSGVPADLAGYRIRYRAGTGWAWSDLAPLHVGRLTSSPYESTVPQLGGIFTVGIVSENDSGLQSTPLLLPFTLANGVAPNMPGVATQPATPTNDNTLTFTGTADAGTTVHMYVDGADVANAATAGTSWSITSPAVADGSRAITFRALAADGNPSQPTTAIVIVVDATAPAAPVISNVSPVNTTDTTPTFTGTGETGCMVQLYRGGSTPAAAPVVVSAGAWSVDLTVLALGSYSITAKQTDFVGNVSPASSPAVTLNIQPVAPAITTTGATTYDTTPTIVGTSTASATIKLYDDGILSSTFTADGSGNWSHATGVLATGANVITATQTVSGIESPASGGITMTITALDTDAAAYIAAMTVEPNSARMGVINTLVTALKTAGVWTKLDALYLLAAHDAQAARLNVRAPASFALTANSSPTFTTDRGYTGTGHDSTAGGFLSSTFNPTTAPSPKFLQNDAHMMVVVRTASSAVANSTNREIGNNLAAISTKGATVGSITTRFNDSGAFLAVPAGTPNSTGFFLVSRAASTGYDRYHAGTSLGAATVTSAAPFNDTFNLLRATTTTYSDAQLSAASWGGSLTSTQEADFNTAVQAYLTAVGA